MHVALLAGSGFSGAGPAWVHRHGDGHRLPPHELRPADALRPLRDAGVEAVLAVHCVGGLHPELAPGRLLVPDDVFDLTGLPYGSDADGAVLHVAFDEPFCPRLRRALLDAADAAGWPHGVSDGGVYTETRGPRLESRAEIRFLATVGDVVGMTAAREAAAARELGLHYASLCVVANHATGVADGEPATARAIVERMEAWSPDVAALVESAARAASEWGDAPCPCTGALGDAAVSGPRPQSGKNALSGAR